MKLFVVAYCSAFENVQEIHFVEAEDPTHALLVFTDEHMSFSADEFHDMSQEDIEEAYFNMDSVIGVKEVPQG